MSRPRVDVSVPALALRRAEAAAACGVSLETFDLHIRPHVPAKRIGGVAVYPVAGLADFLKNATSIAEDLARTPRPTSELAALLNEA
jgi:hypothetical protein